MLCFVIFKRHVILRRAKIKGRINGAVVPDSKTPTSIVLKLLCAGEISLSLKSIRFEICTYILIRRSYFYL